MVPAFLCERMTQDGRRTFLKTAAAAGAVGLAGCFSDDDEEHDLPQIESGEEDEYEQIDQIELMSFTRDFDPLRFQSVELVRDAWQELGLDVEEDIRELGSLFDSYNQQDYDASMMWYSTGADRADPSFFIEIFRPQYAEPGGQNQAGWVNDEYEEVAAEAISTLDEEERSEYVHEAQRLQAEEQPVLWLFHRHPLNVVNTSLFEGWTPHVGNQPFWTLANLMNLEPQTDEQTVVQASDTADELTSNMNPMGIDASADRLTARMIWDRLIVTDEDGLPVPWAAEDWDIIDDTTVEVTLREGMTFHDGEPVTPEDVVFSWEYMEEWTVPSYEPYYSNVDNIETDGQDITFHLESPDAAFIGDSLTRMLILPQHIWDGVTEEEGLDHPDEWVDGLDRTGSGPFEFVQYEAGDRVTYELYDDHFMADEFDIDGLIWRIYGTETAAVGDVEQGEAAYFESAQPDNFDNATDHDDVEGITSVSFGWTGIYLNTNREPFDDTAFRQALASAVDKEQIVDLTFDGHADIASSTVAPSNEAWHNPDAPAFNDGIEGAVDILADAGYRWDDSGNLYKPID